MVIIRTEVAQTEITKPNLILSYFKTNWLNISPLTREKKSDKQK